MTIEEAEKKVADNMKKNAAWMGEKRRAHITAMESLDISKCRLNCRMNQVNKYLDEVKTGNFVDQVAFVDHPTIAGFGCSPDGLVGDSGLIEIKCPNSATHWSYIKSNEPPNKYFIQMQAQMAVTGAKWCDFVSFDPRMPERSQLLIVHVPRDAEFILFMETEIKQFLSEVDAEVKLMENQ
jgi:hypothetical protein